MSASTSIAAIRAAISRKLVSHKMFTSCAAMPASAKNFYLVYKIGFFHIADGKVRETFLGIILICQGCCTHYGISLFLINRMKENLSTPLENT